ncbi:MAG: isochorismatase family protein [Myxococcota bacterium]
MSDAHDRFRLVTAETQLLVVDYQERLFAAMPEGVRDRHAQQAGIAIEGARLLGLPVLVTEQYPKGLGHTLAPLAGPLEGITPFEKLAFSCAKDAPTCAAVDSQGRKRVLVLGMETHICVYQTVLDLVATGHIVHVLADACLSRRKESWRSGLALCEAAGAVVTNTETALFQMLGQAGGDTFKAISKLIR